MGQGRYCARAKAHRLGWGGINEAVGMTVALIKYKNGSYKIGGRLNVKKN